MISEKMAPLMQNNSAIRMMFEEGKRLAAIYGKENVFDFSLGNPSVPAPASVNQAIKDILDEEDSLFVHGYMSNAGYEDVREAIAQSLNQRFGTSFGVGNILMTVGAASGLNVILKTLLNPGEEVIAFAPYFVEYGSYVRNYDGNLVVISPNTVDFQPNLVEFEEKITPKTKAVIINTPNNPTGVIYSEETLKKIAAILEKKQEEYHSQIVLLSDEPYRELVYGDETVPFIPQVYPNTLVCYSYSKSLSLPGERIGYVLVPGEIVDFAETYAAVCGAGRVLGYVNAPSLFQRVAARCTGMTADLSVYARNRDLLYKSLTEMGYSCVKPTGAFYIFPQTLEADDRAFSERAKQYDLLVVPGSDFGAPGHMRISYCVKTETIERALPIFERLAKDYGVK